MLRYRYRKRHKRAMQSFESGNSIIKTAVLSGFRAKSEKNQEKRILYGNIVPYLINYVIPARS